LNQIKAVLFIQFLNSFVSGILAVALPLMMKERNVDIVVIGFVFASMPLIMQLGRMFFATVSDFLGRRIFFIFNGFLGVVSGLIYYFASTPLEFLFGKAMEGSKEGSLWAVNRPFLLETNGKHWRILVHLRTVVYVASAVGSLSAGFFVLWFLYEGTMLFCALIGVFVVSLSLLLVDVKKERFNVEKALHFLDFRKKERIFKIFLVLFFVMGLSFGFYSGFVIPLFLDKNGFTAETVGLIVGVRVLLAGLFSYFFAGSVKMRQFILLSGILHSLTFLLLSFSFSVFAGILVVAYGVVEGILSIGQEGILSKICAKESYGTDIGLLMMGLHVGEASSLALSGLLISLWGFMAPFLLSALTYAFFYVSSYMILEEPKIAN
jgi:MFS family permease